MILIGGNKEQQHIQLNPKMANRHGLIAGATGTGKTVTLQVLAEAFSNIGVTVFAADIKGDLSGIAKAASPHPKISERIDAIRIPEYQARANPVLFWDVYGQHGHPVRTTISEMGPLLLANLLELNDTQSGVLHIAFDIADEQGLLLLDIKDLRSMLNWLSDNRQEVSRHYGNVAVQSVAAIIRKLLVLENSGGDHFFGEPALNINDMMRLDQNGKGYINLLYSRELMLNPKIYSTFLLWLLSELFEELDEVGDPEKPRLVFFFDEAHLLFDHAPKILLQRIEQVVRLIRSKGVGVYFVTQNPTDIPDSVLGQLGNRIQHALRAFTPKDQKAIRVAAETFRPNPKLNTENVITQLSVGEALVSVLDEKGRPTPVEQTLICPPCSKIGPLSDDDWKSLFNQSVIKGIYDTPIDRQSAYEVLLQREQELAQRQANEMKEAEKIRKQSKPARRSNRQSIGEAFTKTLVRTISSGLGRKIVRGLLGSILGTK
ncbi:helicase HerA-like domain-containing protein [Kangiella aquimarina]|uniref:Helicase HerA-like domain-containing protein n=1 Tax=Kangiella aquimarina TaxID=261965 RepID=A0ABZ0X4U1_9GAMM|nr:helicase HerA-like domain-containing protein [Kangiella aquimarina]WQG85625.1 helicase HerA-like domain-containing protein [Kangiella aquimarina]